MSKAGARSRVNPMKGHDALNGSHTDEDEGPALAPSAAAQGRPQLLIVRAEADLAAETGFSWNRSHAA